MVTFLNDSELLTATRHLVRESERVEAELLLHLGEIDERKLYLEGAFPSMFAFCVGELGFSEDAAYSRILVARASRKLPAMIEAIRSGSLHLTGARLLAPHLTADNHVAVLGRAAGKSKREIEELIAALAPQPGYRSIIAALTEDTFRIQFTASRALRDKLREAQDLLRHQIPDGDVAEIFERGINLLIEKTMKERFAVGRKERRPRTAQENGARTRDVPDAMKRAVYQRDGGRCTYVDDLGRRCLETGGLEFDHIEGFARTGRHDVDGIRLLCRAHNQYAAEKLYGREFMERARAAGTTCSGTSSQPDLPLHATSPP